MGDFAKFQRIISRSTKDALVADKKVFEEWNKGEKTTEECIRQFCENNYHMEEINRIDKRLFEIWLYSLAYIDRRK